MDYYNKTEGKIRNNKDKHKDSMRDKFGVSSATHSTKDPCTAKYCCLLGFCLCCGCHRCYLEMYVTGTCYFCTLGCLGFGQLYDCCITGMDTLTMRANSSASGFWDGGHAGR
eukprot:TRINITY_DN338_c0_g1_i1.p1 TRINITY_DN338_c0_g1~~TRINITY_DN338_c0_g1_i1.p1  ORF type:complete len:112 (-),score=15.41 TRINITY_DN338_c0_g1_i1:36-371(-)